MRLKDALEEKKFDTRLQDKHLGENKINQDELDTYFNALGDDTSSATTTHKSSGSSESKSE